MSERMMVAENLQGTVVAGAGEDTGVMAGRRVVSLDLARFLMALFVVGAHGRAFVDISYPVYFATYVGGWARIIMPLFLMISGYFFAVQVKRGVGRWARRVLALHLIWSTIYIGVWMPADSFSVSKAAFWYFFGAGHLWFMPALLGGGLMLYWLRGMSAARLLYLAVGLYLTGAALQFAMDMLVDFKTTAHHNALYAVPRNFLFYGFPFVALGHLMTRDGVLERMKSLTTLPMFAAACGLLATEIYVKYTGFSHEAVFEINIANILLAPMIFVWLMQQKIDRVPAWMAPVSAGIYFVHALVLLILEPVTGLSPTPLTLVAIVVSFGLALVMVRINNKPIPLV